MSGAIPGRVLVFGTKRAPKKAACCEMMTADLKRKCDQHTDRFDCPDMLVARDSKGRYGLIVHDGGSSMIRISFCPWCGKPLPS